MNASATAATCGSNTLGEYRRATEMQIPRWYPMLRIDRFAEPISQARLDQARVVGQHNVMIRSHKQEFVFCPFPIQQFGY